MKTLDVGRALQDAGYLERESQLKEKGGKAMKRLPRINSALTIRISSNSSRLASRISAKCNKTSVDEGLL